MFLSCDVSDNFKFREKVGLLVYKMLETQSIIEMFMRNILPGQRIEIRKPSNRFENIIPYNQQITVTKASFRVYFWKSKKVLANNPISIRYAPSKHAMRG